MCTDAKNVKIFRRTSDMRGILMNWNCGFCGKKGDPLGGILNIPRTGICNKCGTNNNVELEQG